MNDDKERVRLASDLVQVASRYVSLKQVGNRYKACCPFHQEKTPSFSIDAARQTWHCFGACQTGGDVFSFVQRAENLSFPEALQRLADIAGIALQQATESPQQAVARTSQKQRLRDLMTEAQRFFRLAYQNTQGAKDYAHTRGLSDDIINQFGIGWAPDSYDALANHLMSLRLDMDDAIEAGLVFRRNKGNGYTDRFRNRLMFPIHDSQERVIAFGGRITTQQQDTAKYLNSPETPLFSKSQTVYGLPMARKSIQAEGIVMVSEGYMDTVVCHQYGVTNVVATLGTSLTGDHVRILQRYAKTVLLTFDADDAGERAAIKASELFQSIDPDLTIRVLRMPQGADPDSFLQTHGREAFINIASNALNIPEFRLEVLRKKFDLGTTNGKEQFLRAAMRLVADQPSTIDQDGLIRKLAPFHPTFETNSIGAEVALRAEIRRLTPNTIENGPLHGGHSQRKPKFSGKQPRGNRPWETPQYRLMDESIPSATISDSNHVRAQEVLILGLTDATFGTMAHMLITEMGGLDLFIAKSVESLVEQIHSYGDFSSIPTSKALLDLLLASPAASSLTAIINKVQSELDEKMLRDCTDTLIKHHARLTQHEIANQLRPSNQQQLTDDTLRMWQALASARKKHDTNLN
ncbi:MAG: DNA primase [Armatimonadota bacterium]